MNKGKFALLFRIVTTFILFNVSKMQYTLAELTHGLDVTIKGDPECIISGICTIQQSQPGLITFLTNSLYRKYLETTRASAVILTEADANSCPANAVISNNPSYIYAKIAQRFMPKSKKLTEIHPTAVIGNDSEIDSTVSLGPYVVIGRHVKIGPNVTIGAHCFVGDFAEIDTDTQLDANVTIYQGVKIGKRVHIASGAVLGGDGFGFANQNGIWHKIPQIGTVEIGDDVDIGANTTIDRGAIENTVIEHGAKLDNLIQVGHNVRIGANTIIAGCVGIAGSTVIGKNCMIGGAASITGHITICDYAIISGGSEITKSIHEPGMWSTGVGGVVTHQEYRKNNARFHRLESLMQRVKTLELSIKKHTGEE